MAEIKISNKFDPLFQLLEGEHPEVDTVILTSGRLGAKSFTVGLFTLIALVTKGWKILYSRFTNTSIKDSIEAELKEKIPLLGFDSVLEQQAGRVSCSENGSEIVFKGLKTGSKSQTANLKSLSGFNCFVVDEAEETPSYDAFKKVYYSIRSLDKRNLSILILNQTDKEHWIWEEYFGSRDVDQYFNGVKDNVLYINTNYLDLDKDIIPDNILREYDRLKRNNPEEYEHVILGSWLENKEGTLFKKSEIKTFKLKDLNREVVDAKVAYIDVASGGLDYTCMVYAELIGGNVYVTDVVMSKGDSNYTIPACRELLIRKQANYCQVETNNAGKIFLNELEKGIKVTAMIPLYNAGNKETRITNSAFFIKNNIYFRNDYEVGSEYHIFIKQLLSFNIDKKLNVHDDAPDALAGLTNFIHKYYSYYFDLK